MPNKNYTYLNRDAMKRICNLVSILQVALTEKKEEKCEIRLNPIRGNIFYSERCEEDFGITILCFNYILFCFKCAYFFDGQS